MRAYLMALLAALEARVPLALPQLRHDIRLTRIHKKDHLTVQMYGQPQIVLDDEDFDKSPEELADAIAAHVIAAKEARKFIEEEGGRA